MGFLSGKRWPGSVIPYEVAPDILIDSVATTAVNAAIKEWNNRTVMQFIARTQDEPDYVMFRKDTQACNSPVGRQGGKQFISCAIAGSPSAVMHEMGHAVGFFHEHQRPDRDTFVTVTNTAIQNEPVNFAIEQNGAMVTSYDCKSIMHYSVNPGKISTAACPTIGNSVQLTPFDIAAVSGWRELDNNPSTTAIVVHAWHLYQMHSDGRIWIYTGPPLTGWLELDNNPATRAIVASGELTDAQGHLYQLHDNGRIFYYTGPPFTGWLELDNNPATQKIVADGNALYQMHNDGRIWVYTGPPLTGWLELDNNPATVQIAAGRGRLYQKHNDGRIWQYTGPPLTGWTQLPRTGHIAAVKQISVGGPWPSFVHEVYQLHSDGRILSTLR